MSMNTVGRPTAPNAVTSMTSGKPATLTGARGLLQDEP
jgi:glycine dehydrogenase subunit 2